MKSRHPLRRTAIAAAAAFVASTTLALPAAAATYNWSSGTFVSGVTAPSPLPAADVLNILNGGFKYFDANFTSQGTVNWQADNVYFQNGGVFNNAGLWDSQFDGSLVNNGGAQPGFNNTGTFRKSAGDGSTNIGNIGFVNSGTIDAQVGSITFNAGATFNAGSQFTGAGRTLITGGASFNGALTSQNLVLQGGTFTGTAAVIGGAVSFTGGRLSGTWEVSAGQSLNAGDGGFKYFSGADTVLTNKGTVNWNTGNLFYFESGATLSNQGLYLAAESTSLANNGGATPAFVNTASGTLRAAAGKTLNVAGIAFANNGGVLDAESGAAIVYAGGNATFNDSTRFTGAGANRVTNNASFNGAIDSANLKLEGGTFTGGSAVLKGSTSFTGGRFTGTWEVAAGHTLRAGDGGFKYLNGADTVLTNKGTVEWATGDALYLESGATLSNQALFTASADTSLLNNGGATPGFINSASGTLRAEAGKTLTIGSIAFVNNGGTLLAQAGGSNVFSGGNVTFNAGTTFSGDGSNRVSSNAAFNGTFTSANLVLQGGQFTGTNAVMNGSAQFNGGLFAGTWDVAAGHTLKAGDGGFKYLSGEATVFTNRGTVNWSTANAWYLQSGATLDNRGLFEATETASVLNNGGALPNFVNGPAGTVRAAAGKTMTIGTVAFTNNGGTLDALAGATMVHSGGRALFNDGTRFTGAGSNVVTSNAAFVGGFTSQNLTLQSGTFTGGDGSAGSKAVMSGTTVFTGGALTGQWEVASGQTLKGADGGFKYLSGEGTTLTNKGTIAWTTGNPLYMQSGAQLANAGTYDLQGDGGLFNNGGSAPSIVNTGLLVKSAGAGVSTIGNGIALQNLGTIDVQTGTLALPNNFGNEGLLKGTGTLQSNVLTNNGHVSPGASIGTLSIAGSFVQGAGGTFDVDIGSLLSNDLLLVSGTATLDGTLALHCFAACSLAVGDEVVILDSVGNLGGSFATVTLNGFKTGAFTVDYDLVGDRVLLHVTESVTAVPEPQTWALMLGGLMLMGHLVRRRTRR
jgi:hypothetical protein